MKKTLNRLLTTVYIAAILVIPGVLLFPLLFDYSTKCSQLCQLSAIEYASKLPVVVRSELAPGYGSGTVFRRPEADYVLTACHVVTSNIKTEIIDYTEDGTEVIKISTYPVIVRFYNGPDSDTDEGYSEVKSEIIAFSYPDYGASFEYNAGGHDLAVLKLEERAPSVAVFGTPYMEDDYPQIGTSVIHAGTFNEMSGHNSISQGIISRLNIFSEAGRNYTQVNTSVLPGSSGGPVILANSRQYIGLVTHGTKTSVCYIAPIQRIRSWLHDINMDYVLQPALPVTKRKD